MTLVRIVKSWTSPDLLRQTLGGHGVWGDCQFTLDPVERCDYLIVLNHIPRAMTVEVAPENVWCLIQETPETAYRWMEKGFAHYARIYTPDARLRRSGLVQAHGALPWHVGRTYDELRALMPPPKKRHLSWITSNLAVKRGHQLRLNFLERLKNAGVPFDLFGRGFTPIPDKWDGLAPYRYSIAVENHSCAHYWTEKIADCFLAWTMPIYFGATSIRGYFPAESFVWIEIGDPDAPRQVAEVLRSDRAERHRDAIAEARRRVLEVHQLFPRVADLIAADLEAAPKREKRRLSLPAVPDLTGYYRTTTIGQRFWHRVLRRVRGLRVLNGGGMKPLSRESHTSQ